MGRTVAVCTNCNEEREIAAHGLCFKCYRAEERDKQVSTETWMKSDKHSKDMRQAQKKTRKALMKMMDALEEIQEASLVPLSIVNEWRKLLQPEVARIAFSLGPGGEASKSPAPPEREETGEKETKPSGSLRTDVINALVAQGYNRSDAVMMTDNATGHDFETLFKSALRHAYPRQVNSEHVDASELFTELEQVNSEHENADELFTPEDSEQVNSEHADASEHVHMDEEVERAREEAANTTPTTKKVNSEQKDASEQFTEFGQAYKLPPTVEQTIKQIKGAKHAL